MGCNCGKKRQKPADTKSGQTESFALIMPDGQSFVFGSLLEAEAARIRAGRRGHVRPA